MVFCCMDTAHERAVLLVELEVHDFAKFMLIHNSQAPGTLLDIGVSAPNGEQLSSRLTV